MFESGLLVCLIGFGMVFVVLAILILMIYAISWVTRRLVKEKPEQETPAAPVTVAGDGSYARGAGRSDRCACKGAE